MSSVLERSKTTGQIELRTIDWKTERIDDLKNDMRTDAVKSILGDPERIEKEARVNEMVVDFCKRNSFQRIVGCVPRKDHQSYAENNSPLQAEVDLTPALTELAESGVEVLIPQLRRDVSGPWDQELTYDPLNDGESIWPGVMVLHAVTADSTHLLDNNVLDKRTEWDHRFLHMPLDGEHQVDGWFLPAIRLHEYKGKIYTIGNGLGGNDTMVRSIRWLNDEREAPYNNNVFCYGFHDQRTLPIAVEEFDQRYDFAITDKGLIVPQKMNKNVVVASEQANNNDQLEEAGQMGKSQAS